MIAAEFPKTPSPKPARIPPQTPPAGGKSAEAGRIISPRQIVSPCRVRFNHLDSAQNTFELCPTNTAMIKIETDGDPFEKNYWNLFIKDQFPSYEKFWVKFVVPLTNRPGDGHFKKDVELIKINKNSSDICIAQLNYSIIKHLAQCWHILRDLKDNTGLEQIDLLTEGFARLVGAQDNAFELIERLNNPLLYQPFLEKEGEKARKKYKEDHNYPLQNIRSYRNSLLHGRLLPGIVDGSRFCLPNIGKESLYLDWRMITQLSSDREKYKRDFVSVLFILESAWVETLNYLENNWRVL